MKWGYLDSGLGGSSRQGGGQGAEGWHSSTAPRRAEGHAQGRSSWGGPNQISVGGSDFQFVGRAYRAYTGTVLGIVLNLDNLRPKP